LGCRTTPRSIFKETSLMIGFSTGPIINIP